MAIVVANRASAPVAALKDGTYKATLTNIKQFSNTYGQRIGFEFTVLGGPADGEKVMRSTAPQLTKQSKLAEVIEGMLGRDLTDKEIQAFWFCSPNLRQGRFIPMLSGCSASNKNTPAKRPTVPKGKNGRHQANQNERIYTNVTCGFKGYCC